VIELVVVTPQKKLVDRQVAEVMLPGTEGYFGVLPGHAPFLTSLKVGEITYREGSETHRLSVAWGFAEVLPEKVSVLADIAERAEEIDLPRAERAKQRAEGRLREGGGDVDWERARAALERAVARIQVCSKR